MKQNKSSFKWRHFEPSLILLCVRWYCRYQLSYRDVEEMMHERGLDVDHTTVFRWVQRYAPEINKRMRRRSPPDESFASRELRELRPAVDVAGQLLRQRLTLLVEPAHDVGVT
jgi:transposase-like protein